MTADAAADAASTGAPDGSIARDVGDAQNEAVDGPMIGDAAVGQDSTPSTDATAADAPMPDAMVLDATSADAAESDATGSDATVFDAVAGLALCEPRSFELVSVDSTGHPANDDSLVGPFAFSSDGRFVTFVSSATNLDPMMSTEPKVLTHDRLSGATRLASVDSSRVELPGLCFSPSISGDGRFAGFYSYNGPNFASSVFLFDSTTGTSTIISFDYDRRPTTTTTGDRTTITADGRYVAFASASALSIRDVNRRADVYVYDGIARTNELASVTSLGYAGNGDSYDATISGDGRFVVFASTASDLVAGDLNNVADVFVRDRQTASTWRASVDSAGNEGLGPSEDPKVSSDGRLVVFTSQSALTPRTSSTCPGGVHLHDMLSRTTEFIAVDSNGRTLDGCSSHPSMSGDGRFVLFWSNTTAVPNNVGGTTDNLFIRDRMLETTTWIAPAQRDDSAISQDGRFIAFDSFDPLHPGNTRGRAGVYVVPNPPCP
jgi:Tol biopolymer transport system component